MTHPQTFIDRWQSSEAAERANYQLFLSELCDLLEVPRPVPAGRGGRRGPPALFADLTIGVDVASASLLRANENLSSRGVLPLQE